MGIVFRDDETAFRDAREKVLRKSPRWPAERPWRMARVPPIRGGAPIPTDPYAAIDGSLNAPAGPAQYPNFFTSATGGPQNVNSNNTNAPYAVRPAWKVSGIDFAVGIPNTITLIDPVNVLATGTGPGGPASNTLSTSGSTASGSVLPFSSTIGVLVGMTVSGTNIPGNTTVKSKTPTTVTISNNISGTVSNAATITFGGITVGELASSGAFQLYATVDNMVFDSLDLTRGGGWQLYADNANNPVVQNCLGGMPGGIGLQEVLMFLGQGNGFPGQGLTVRNCVIDGTNSNDCIDCSRGGTHVIEYNWLKNGNAQLLIAGSWGRLGTSYTIKYNIFENTGTTQSAGNHCDIIITFGSGLSVSNQQDAVVAFTNGSANIGWTANQLFLNDQVVFEGGVPTGFAVDTIYYVVTTGTNTIQVSATSGGSPITAGSAQGSTCVGSSWFPYSYDIQFNTVIQVWSNLLSGALGLTLESGGHFGSNQGLQAIFDLLTLNYNTMVNNGGPFNSLGGLAWICQAVSRNASVQNNYVDIGNGTTGGNQFVVNAGANASGIPASPPYNAVIAWNNNLDLKSGNPISSPF